MNKNIFSEEFIKEFLTKRPSSISINLSDEDEIKVELRIIYDGLRTIPSVFSLESFIRASQFPTLFIEKIIYDYLGSGWLTEFKKVKLVDSYKYIIVNIYNQRLTIAGTPQNIELFYKNFEGVVNRQCQVGMFSYVSDLISTDKIQNINVYASTGLDDFKMSYHAEPQTISEQIGKVKKNMIIEVPGWMSDNRAIIDRKYMNIITRLAENYILSQKAKVIDQKYQYDFDNNCNSYEIILVDGHVVINNILDETSLKTLNYKVMTLIKERK